MACGIGNLPIRLGSVYLEFSDLKEEVDAVFKLFDFFSGLAFRPPVLGLNSLETSGLNPHAAFAH
jgi:hypothetical protein